MLGNVHCFIKSVAQWFEGESEKVNLISEYDWLDNLYWWPDKEKMFVEMLINELEVWDGFVYGYGGSNERW